MASYYSDSIENDFLKRTIEVDGKIQGLLSLSRLVDFSDFLEFSVYLLKNYLVLEEKADSVLPLLEKRLHEVILNLPSSHCIVAKLPIDNYKCINSLIKMDFYYVGGESIFSLDLSKPFSYELPHTDRSLPIIRLAKEKDLSKIKNLSSESHFDIRYLHDPNFDADRVKSYYTKIAMDSFSKKNHFVFVAEEENKIKGFITAIENKNLIQSTGRHLASLDYIAVSPSCQQKNLGYMLNCHALNYLKGNGINGVSVKTMASNYRAIRLLKKNGFTLTSQNTVLHRWNINKK